ncbi:MAG TPA: septal ring lytic transglycosylase RlpA family protein [Cyanothece sp. UBA12306]|nr:septal ring lytic transglycosylase RlpA family protein [Cyanothece sp. UBA12306]
MNNKLWRGLTTTALTAALGTSAFLYLPLNGSVASEIKDKADDLGIGKLLGTTTTQTTESSQQLTALAPKVVSLSQVEPLAETEDPKETVEKSNVSAIATIDPHQWKYKLAVTLKIRDIPVLTFLGTKADLAQIRENQNQAEQTQPEIEVVKQAEAVAKKLNQIAQNEKFEAKNITVTQIQKNKAYSIKINNQELVRIDGQTILPDTTNNLAADALQATNRLRRLMGNAPPLTAIGNTNSALARVQKRVKSTRKGMASWYGPGFHGRRTANGERYNQNGLTAAHKSLPFGTQVRVTNLNNGRSITVRINDRGPYAHGRIIDLSKGAARTIGLISSGVAPVQIEILGR